MIKVNTIEITQEILSLLSEIDEFKGAWRSFGLLAPDRLQALKFIATIESIGSSTRIEGSKLSDLEVEQLLKQVNIRDFNNRDKQEVAGYSEVMNTVLNSWQEIPITENYIKQLHRDLLRYSDKDERHRGEYKTIRNDIGAFNSEGKMVGVIFETATPFETPKYMRELISWLKKTQELKSMHPILAIAVFIVIFLEIHPFQDGNGRLSRVLTTLLLLKEGYAYVPYSSLESVIESNKDNYYLALRQTQSTIRTSSPNWQPWIMFFLRSIQKQKCNLEIKIKHEQSYISDLPELALVILDYLKNHGRVTNRDIARKTGASPNTLKTIFTQLVKKNLIVKHGGGRSTWYSRL